MARANSGHRIIIIRQQDKTAQSLLAHCSPDHTKQLLELWLQGARETRESFNVRRRRAKVGVFMSRIDARRLYKTGRRIKIIFPW